MPYDPNETKELLEKLEEILAPKEKDDLPSPREQEWFDERAIGQMSSGSSASSSVKPAAPSIPGQEASVPVRRQTTAKPRDELAPRRPALPPAQKPDDLAPRRPAPPQTQKPGELAPRRPASPQTQKPGDLAPRRPTTPQAPKQGDLAQKRPIKMELYDNDIIPMRPGAVRKKDKVVMYDVDIRDEGEADKSNERSKPELDIGDENTKLKYDFEKNYRDIQEKLPMRPRREKRTGLIGGVLYAAFIICISLVLGSVLWMATADVLGFTGEDEQVNVTVHEGFTIEDIIDTIYDAQLIKYKALFRLYAEYSNAEEKITPGSYALNKNLDYRSIVYGMTARGGARREISVPIPEGFTLTDIFTRLEVYGVCKSDDLWEAAANHDFKHSFLDSATLGQKSRLEGFLFPDTYNFYLDSTAVSVITKLLNEFNNKYTETYVERAEFMGYSINEIVTIASMIEREAGNDDERPRIAAVIYNRLNNNDFPMLQIDATIHYAIAGTSIPFSTEFDSPYNTYMYEGLPPGPIANPGMASIRAALYPDSTNEYYYALSKSGSHEFFQTRQEHEAFVAGDEYDG